jgi:hypothetical protein
MVDMEKEKTEHSAEEANIKYDSSAGASGHDIFDLSFQNQRVVDPNQDLAGYSTSIKSAMFNWRNKGLDFAVEISCLSNDVDFSLGKDLSPGIFVSKNNIEGQPNYNIKVVTDSEFLSKNDVYATLNAIAPWIDSNIKTIETSTFKKVTGADVVAGEIVNGVNLQAIVASVDYEMSKLRGRGQVLEGLTQDQVGTILDLIAGVMARDEGKIIANNPDYPAAPLPEDKKFIESDE